MGWKGRALPTASLPQNPREEGGCWRSPLHRVPRGTGSPMGAVPQEGAAGPGGALRAQHQVPIPLHSRAAATLPRHSFPITSLLPPQPTPLGGHKHTPSLQSTAGQAGLCPGRHLMSQTSWKRKAFLAVPTRPTSHPLPPLGLHIFHPVSAGKYEGMENQTIPQQPCHLTPPHPLSPCSSHISSACVQLPASPLPWGGRTCPVPPGPRRRDAALCPAPSPQGVLRMRAAFSAR